MKNATTSLIVGVDGLIGRALAVALTNVGQTVIGTTRRATAVSETNIFLDLTADIANWHPPCQIDVAYLCAAVSSLEQCRQNPEVSFLVNVFNTIELAKALVSSGTFVIFLSTNQVYDGSIPFRNPDDLVCPRTEYGRQKAEVERQLLALGSLVSIVRLTKILSFDTLLFQGWIQSLRNNQVIHPFSDMVMAPVPLSFAVSVLSQLAKVRLPGIIQISGEKDVTYEQVAYYIAQQIGAKQELIKPLTSKEANLPLESISLHTTLNTNRLYKDLGMKVPNVENTLILTLNIER
jgi:dTDP-4-dehydrorhamnose reductase